MRTSRRSLGLRSRSHLVPTQVELWNRLHQRDQPDRENPDRRVSRDAFINAIGTIRPLDVLDIGCGRGSDAVSFALDGLNVWASDHSSVALSNASNSAFKANARINFVPHDTSSTFPFDSCRFDGIYAHLSLHYFNDSVTRRIFSDILRLTKPDGILCFSVRSALDPLYGQGDIVDKDMYCVDGHLRHFFNEDYIRDILIDWKLLSIGSFEMSPSVSSNPGVFIRAVARRLRHEELPTNADRALFLSAPRHL